MKILPFQTDSGASAPETIEGTADAGPIAITVSRSKMQCAPDSVRFGVDLSRARFDVTRTRSAVTGTRHETDYDPRLHELIFLWDLGDDGVWKAPEKGLPDWRRKRFAKGPWVAHVYDRPGIYKVRLTVIEPHSGKIARAPEVEITVADPDPLYAASRTLCINPEGDEDFRGAPPGALKVVLPKGALLDRSSRIWGLTRRRPSVPVRVLFKAGASFDVAMEIDQGDADSMFFGRYGAGARPVVRVLPGREGLRVWGRYLDLDGLETCDLRVSGLYFKGDFDPRSDAPGHEGRARHGILIQKYLDTVIHDCEFSGFARSSVITEPSTVLIPSHTHLDDCILRDFGGQYPTYWQPIEAPGSSVSLTGFRGAQTPRALAHKGTRAVVRINHVDRCHIRGCDLYHTDHTQPCFKLQETPLRDGSIVNVHSCALEGGVTVLNVNTNSNKSFDAAGTRDGGAIQNAIIDGNVLVGHYRTATFMNLHGQGITIRNNLCIQGAMPHHIDALRSFILARNHGERVTSQVAPVQVYNNSFVMLRDQGQNNGRAPEILALQHSGGNSDFSDVAEQNNLLHMPAMLETAYAPLDEQTLLWVPRNLGLTSLEETGGRLETAFSTPPDTVRRFAPLPGSPALGAALEGLVSYRDIAGRERPAYPSIGAWEAPES